MVSSPSSRSSTATALLRVPSGLRSSWPSMARNSSLARFAACSERARASASSRRARLTSSCSLRSVMSSATLSSAGSPPKVIGSEFTSRRRSSPARVRHVTSKSRTRPSRSSWRSIRSRCSGEAQKPSPGPGCPTISSREYPQWLIAASLTSRCRWSRRLVIDIGSGLAWKATRKRRSLSRRAASARERSVMSVSALRMQGSPSKSTMSAERTVTRSSPFFTRNRHSRLRTVRPARSSRIPSSRWDGSTQRPSSTGVRPRISSRV
jgi:hypothetical protein